jgi:hypothetical protein
MSEQRRCRDLLRTWEVKNLVEMKRQGLSIQAMSGMTGFDRKTVEVFAGAGSEAVLTAAAANGE